MQMLQEYTRMLSRVSCLTTLTLAIHLASSNLSANSSATKGYDVHVRRPQLKVFECFFV